MPTGVYKRKPISEETRQKHIKAATNISEETRRKMSDSHKGEKNHNWQFGKTLFSKQIRSSYRYRLWRSDIFNRDNYICQICERKRTIGDRVILHADHIKPFFILLDELNIKSLEDGINCEELWNIDNGRTLCKECHQKTETYGHNRKKRKLD